MDNYEKLYRRIHNTALLGSEQEFYNTLKLFKNEKANITPKPLPRVKNISESKLKNLAKIHGVSTTKKSLEVLQKDTSVAQMRSYKAITKIVNNLHKKKTMEKIVKYYLNPSLITHHLPKKFSKIDKAYFNAMVVDLGVDERDVKFTLHYWSGVFGGYQEYFESFRSIIKMTPKKVLAESEMWDW